MKTLYPLLRCMTPAEWAAFQLFLSCFSTNPGESKQLRLARMIHDSASVPDDAECSRHLYGNNPESAFPVLKSRLKEKLYDFLLTDLASDKFDKLQGSDLASNRVHKKAALFTQLIYTKDRMQCVYELLDQGMELAREFELFEAGAWHVWQMASSKGWKGGPEAYDDLCNETRRLFRFSRILFESEQLYYRLAMLQHDYQSLAGSKTISRFLRTAVPRLERYYKETQSSRINYFRMFVRLGKFEHERRFTEARSECLRLLDLVRSSKPLYRLQRIGVVYDNLSRCEYNLGNFDNALAACREAQKLFPAGSENLAIAIEQEYYVFIAMGKFEEANGAANRMLTIGPPAELGLFRHAKYNCLLAWSHFALRQYNEVLNILAQSPAFAIDRSGWEVGKRLLYILTLVEQGSHDEASRSVHALHQYVKRLTSEWPVSGRVKKIMNLLLILERNGFQFSGLKNITEKYLQPLASVRDPDLCWDPFSSEVVAFHKWFSSQMKPKVPVPVRRSGRP